MITLITAVPGSGKTLLSVGLIWGYLEEGRPVYTNIAGLKKEEFPNNNLLFDAPDDWTETPDGSVVIYDECQQPHLYPATGERGKVLDKRLTAMETHRHTGHDLFFITQAPTFVHHHVRKLVGSHIHLYRGSGSKIVGRYEWSHTCDAPNDRREQERADFTTFRFNPEHYKLYQSSTVHTHKFKIPKKILLIFIFILAVAVPALYTILTSDFMPWSNKKPEAIPTVVAASAPAPASQLPASLKDVPLNRSLSGCMESENRGCMCWDDSLQPLDMPDAQCRALLLRPLPRTLSTSSKHG